MSENPRTYIVTVLDLGRHYRVKVSSIRLPHFFVNRAAIFNSIALFVNTIEIGICTENKLEVVAVKKRNILLLAKLTHQGPFFILTRKWRWRCLIGVRAR